MDKTGCPGWAEQMLSNTSLLPFRRNTASAQYAGGLHLTAAHDGWTRHVDGKAEKRRTLRSTPIKYILLDRPVHVVVAAMFTVCHSVGGSRPSHMLPNRPRIGIEIITSYFFFSRPEEPTRGPH